MCHTARGNDVIWQAITNSSSCLIHTCERGCLLLLSKNTMFTKLSLGCLSSRHKTTYIYQVSSSTVVFFVSYMHVHAPFIMYCSTLFVVVFQEMICLHIFNLTLFVGSQSFISLPSFMFVSATVSELHESNQNKEIEEEFSYFHLSWVYNSPFFLSEVPFEHMYAFNVLEVPYTTN